MTINWEEIRSRIVRDERYQRNIQYGKPRRGHEEGTVAAHIEELTNNLEYLNHKLSLPTELYWQLNVLIHVHDSFKAEAKRDSAILDPQSHASLARAFLAEFTNDEDMLNIVQFHDLGYAVYRKLKQTGKLDEEKLEHGLQQIKDKDLLLLFSIIDSCTASKGREMITWFVEEVKRRYPEEVCDRVTEWILPGPMLVGGTW